MLAVDPFLQGQFQANGQTFISKGCRPKIIKNPHNKLLNCSLAQLHFEHLCNLYKIKTTGKEIPFTLRSTKKPVCP